MESFPRLPENLDAAGEFWGGAQATGPSKVPGKPWKWTCSECDRSSDNDERRFHVDGCPQGDECQREFDEARAWRLQFWADERAFDEQVEQKRLVRLKDT